MAIAESLKRFRKEFGLTQKQVAEAIGILPAAFAQYESPFKGGKPVSPSIDLVVKIARLFNVSTDYLAGLTDDPTPVLKKNDAPITIEKTTNKLTLENLSAEFEELKARVEKLESSK